MARRRMQARVNRAVRWGGPALFLLVATAYIASSFRCVGVLLTWHHAYIDARVCRGQVRFFQRHLDPNDAWTQSSEPWNEETLLAAASPLGKEPYSEWKYCLGFALGLQPWASHGQTREDRVPLWPALLMWPAQIVSRRWRDRSGASRVVRCASCNYDLAGLPPGAPCPECAASPPNEADGRRSPRAVRLRA
jgi:hypothetical protein